MRLRVLSHVWLSVTPWTTARQTPLSMRFSRQEYWKGLPFPPPGDLPGPGIKPKSPVPPALAGGFFTTKSPGNPYSDPWSPRKLEILGKNIWNLVAYYHLASYPASVGVQWPLLSFWMCFRSFPGLFPVSHAPCHLCPAVPQYPSPETAAYPLWALPLILYEIYANIFFESLCLKLFYLGFVF